mgnify:CR=1 FL=1
MGAGEFGHFLDEARGAGGDDIAGVAEVGIGIVAFFGEDAVEDHGKEVIDEGCVPTVEELFFEIAVMGDEFVGAELGERYFQFEGGVETGLEVGDLLGKAKVGTDEAEGGFEEGEGVAPF